MIAWQLLSGLASRGHQIVACAREVDIVRDSAFEVVETGRGARLESLEPLVQARRVERAFGQHGGAKAFDVVHWIFPPSMDELAFAPASRTPFVYGPHALEWPQDGRRRLRAGDVVRAAIRPVLRRRSRAALSSARLLLVAVPEAAASLPVDPGERGRVLPFGVDAARFRPSPLPEQPTILFVANLEPRKRCSTVIAALAQLRTDARLVVAGVGTESEQLRRQAEAAGVAERVTWVGQIPHERMPELLSGASLVCSASIGEPYGMTLLEGMAAGRAVVAMDAGGPRFLVDRDRGGALVWPPEPEPLADALDGLLSDRGRLVAAGEWNRARVERELSWDRVLDRLEQIYAEAVAA